MAQPFYIEASDETLRVLGEKFKPVEDDRFLYCLQNRKWTVEDVHKFNAHLRIGIDYASMEFERIKELRKVYNLDFPSDHKRYFSTVVDMMSRMRSTLSTYKNNLNKFRPRKSKKGSISNDPTSLHSGPYSKDFFGWEVYNDDAVKELYNVLNSFLKLANAIYLEADAIIEEEKEIRSDPNKACPRYERSRQRSLKTSSKIIEALKDKNVDFDNDIVKAMEAAEDVRLMIASLFHELSSSDFNYVCVCKAISDGRKVGLTPEESTIFGKANEKAVQKLKILLDHILELAEKMKGTIKVVGWKGMLDGEFVMHLLFWCGWDGIENQKLLSYVKKRCEGKIEVVKMGAVMREKRKLVRKDNDTIIKEQNAFNQQMDAFVNTFLAESAPKVA